MTLAAKNDTNTVNFQVLQPLSWNPNDPEGTVYHPADYYYYLVDNVPFNKISDRDVFMAEIAQTGKICGFPARVNSQISFLGQGSTASPIEQFAIVIVDLQNGVIHQDFYKQTLNSYEMLGIVVANIHIGGALGSKYYLDEYGQKIYYVVFTRPDLAITSSGSLITGYGEVLEIGTKLYVSTSGIPCTAASGAARMQTSDGTPISFGSIKGIDSQDVYFNVTLGQGPSYGSTAGAIATHAKLLDILDSNSSNPDTWVYGHNGYATRIVTVAGTTSAQAGNAVGFDASNNLVAFSSAVTPPFGFLLAKTSSKCFVVVEGEWLVTGGTSLTPGQLYYLTAAGSLNAGPGTNNVYINNKVGRAVQTQDGSNVLLLELTGADLGTNSKVNTTTSTVTSNYGRQTGAYLLGAGFPGHRRFLTNRDVISPVVGFGYNGLLTGCSKTATLITDLSGYKPTRATFANGGSPQTVWGYSPSTNDSYNEQWPTSIDLSTAADRVNGTTDGSTAIPGAHLPKGAMVVQRLSPEFIADTSGYFERILLFFYSGMNDEQRQRLLGVSSYYGLPLVSASDSPHSISLSSSGTPQFFSKTSTGTEIQGLDSTRTSYDYVKVQLNAADDFESRPISLTPTVNGLLGTYYLGTSLSGDPVLQRVDSTINLSWGTGQSPCPAIGGSAAFSTRWIGKVTPRYSEKYTFYVKADNASRLWIWINGTKYQLIDNWTNPTLDEHSGTTPVALTGGQSYDIELDYYEDTIRPASISFSWSSDKQGKEVIPSDHLSCSPYAVGAIPTTTGASKGISLKRRNGMVCLYMSSQSTTTGNSHNCFITYSYYRKSVSGGIVTYKFYGARVVTSSSTFSTDRTLYDKIQSLPMGCVSLSVNPASNDVVVGLFNPNPMHLSLLNKHKASSWAYDYFKTTDYQSTLDSVLLAPLGDSLAHTKTTATLGNKSAIFSGSAYINADTLAALPLPLDYSTTGPSSLFYPFIDFGLFYKNLFTAGTPYTTYINSAFKFTDNLYYTNTRLGSFFAPLSETKTDDQFRDTFIFTSPWSLSLGPNLRTGDYPPLMNITRATIPKLVGVGCIVYVYKADPANESYVTLSLDEEALVFQMFGNYLTQQTGNASDPVYRRNYDLLTYVNGKLTAVGPGDSIRIWLPPLAIDDLRATQGIDKDIQTRQLPALQLTYDSTASSPSPHTAGLDRDSDNLPLNPRTTGEVGYTVDFSNTGAVTFLRGGSNSNCESSCVGASGASGEIIGTVVKWEPKPDNPDYCRLIGCTGYLSLYKQGCSSSCWSGQVKGYFDIKGIPDGNYTLDIVNDESDELSRLITITGGKTTDLGTIITNIKPCRYP
jgi:hypothetical protein